jgi:hypothetical protein
MFSGQFPWPTDGDKPSTWSGKKTGFETSSGLALERGKHLAAAGQVFRRTRPDGNLGNYLDSRDVEDPSLIPAGPQPQQGRSAVLSEDDVKRKLQNWLEAAGWHVHVIWGRGCGIDIEARDCSHRWVIEVKGSGSRDPMRVNYFLAILGELLQRMTDPNASYSSALPDMPQFRGLWQRLPPIAKTQHASRLFSYLLLVM